MDRISLSVCRDVRRAPLPGHTSAQDSGASALRERVIAQGRFGRRCHYCDLAFGDGKAFEVHNLDGDHRNEAIENLVPICILCHLPFHLDLVQAVWPSGGSIAPDAGRIILCPELSQVELNAMLHALFFYAAAGRAENDEEKERKAWRVYHRLLSRADALERVDGAMARPGMSQVHVVAKLLKDQSETWYAQRDTWLEGCRYLPPYEPMLRVAPKLAADGAAFSRIGVGGWLDLIRDAA